MRLRVIYRPLFSACLSNWSFLRHHVFPLKSDKVFSLTIITYIMKILVRTYSSKLLIASILIGLISSMVTDISSVAIASEGTIVLQGATFETSKGTRNVPSISGTSSRNELRQAAAIAQIALADLNADVDNILPNEVALRKEIAAYEKTKKDEETAYAVIKAKYDKRLEQYEMVLKPLDAEIAAVQ